MREIKFRAWNQEHKKMIYDIPLSYVTFYGSLEAFFYNTAIMQYTGFSVYRESIYEGDILGNKATGEVVGKVYYDENILAFCVEMKHRWEYLHDCVHMDIIGNIYENPELLQDEQV